MQSSAWRLARKQRWGLVLLLAMALAAFRGATADGARSNQPSGEAWTPDIPRTWDLDAIEFAELPLPRPGPRISYISSDSYYSMPVRPVFKSYPVYRPDREPAGYLDSLSRYAPQIIFDPTRLHTQQDWIDAGADVFQAPTRFLSSGVLVRLVRDPAWYQDNAIPVTRDGVLPFMRYVVREQGRVELGVQACAMCHARVMPDGSVIVGAPGNFPDDRSFAYETRKQARSTPEPDAVLAALRQSMRRQYAAPWVEGDTSARTDTMSLDDIAKVLEAIPPGASARQGASPLAPARIPDLIGVKDRLYLDASGRQRQRSIGDLMRYAALNQGADLLSWYGDFRPVGELPDPSTQSRYSDEQLYALALYVYSLQPPARPPSDTPPEVVERGRRLFHSEGCDGCHTPPLYTDNKILPVVGFKVPARHRREYDVDPKVLETDPYLTLKTRRGTGYYKVPSLKGLWYRGLLSHDGSVATLEDWLDPARLRDDYVPTGFRGAGVRTRAVKGHPYGLDLGSEDRRALIAFLRTL